MVRLFRRHTLRGAALASFFCLTACGDHASSASVSSEMDPQRAIQTAERDRGLPHRLTDAGLPLDPWIDTNPDSGTSTPRDTDGMGREIPDTGAMDPSDIIDEPAEARPSLGMPESCDIEEALRYENFVKAANCPGPCCWELPGEQLRDDPKRTDLIRPTIHSAYNDYPTSQLPSDVPSPSAGLKYYVPLAKFSLADHIEETSVGCVTDADCRAIGSGLTATCARQDGDGDGEPYEDFRSTEYRPCVDGQDCVDSGGFHGDLATQSAVPRGLVDGMCEDVPMPEGGECLEQLSLCVYSPAWVSHPSEVELEAGRSAPEVRPSGQLFIQGINLVDTDMQAHFVRVRSADRNGAPTDFSRMTTDPVSGDVVIRMQNGMTCPMNAEGGDCSPQDSNGQLRIAVQPNTITRGSVAAATEEAPDALAPMHWYLERENQWLRYHQRIQDGPTVDFGFAELYDDLVIADVPENLAPGLYAVQLSYSTNTWLSSLEETFGRQNACMARTLLRDQCLAGFENQRIAERQCAALVVDCDDPSQSVALERDRPLLTNPIYIQIAPNQLEQTYRIQTESIKAVVSGEYGPGAYGERNRADIWVSDDVNIFSMIVRFDPTQVDADTTCSLGSGDERPSDPACAVSGPWVHYIHDIEPGRVFDLQAHGFSADIKVRPGEVVNIVTFAFDTDGRRGDSNEELFGILDGADNLLGGVALTVASAYGAEGIGQGVSGAISGIFGMTRSLIGGLTDPELITISVSSYTAEELAALTLGRQMGLSASALKEHGLVALQDRPLFETRFQNVDYDITETVMPVETSQWGLHRETRRFESRAPDAEEFGCIREHLLNSCAYRGHSTYELNIGIEHIR